MEKLNDKIGLAVLIGILLGLVAVLAIIKYVAVDISWWFVLLPIWGFVTIVLVVLLMVAVAAFLDKD